MPELDTSPNASHAQSPLVEWSVVPSANVKGAHSQPLPVIVVDASLVIEVVLQTDDGVRITGNLFESGRTWHAPHLLDVEVAQVLRRYVAREELTDERARHALDVLAPLVTRNARLARTPGLATAVELV